MRRRCRRLATTVDCKTLSDADIVALEIVPSLDLGYGTAMSAGNPAEIVSALDSVDNHLTCTSVLYLLDRYRIEVLGCLVYIN